MSGDPGSGGQEGFSEMHRALVGVSRLGELRQRLVGAAGEGREAEEVDGLLALLNGTIAEINDQIDEAISLAAARCGDGSLN